MLIGLISMLVHFSQQKFKKNLKKFFQNLEYISFD